MQSNGIAIPVKPTQSPRPQTPWLVTLPASDTTHVTRSSFAAACRGHEKIGEVLGYFVYEASWQAKNEGLDVQSSDCTFITIHREAKHMLTRMKVCQKSLIAYIKQLSEWGFITADGYRHTYQVHFQAINAAIQHPPEAIKRKPRGQHAPKPDVKVQSSERLTKLQSHLTKLQSRFVKIQTEIVNLQTRIVKIQTEIVKIQSSESCESASEQGVMGDTEASRIYKNTKRSNKKKDSFVVSARAENNGDASLSLSSSLEEERDTQLVEVTIPEGDHILIERLPDGQKKIRRASGKPLGELIPFGMDVQEGLQALISIEGTLEERGTQPLEVLLEETVNGNAPTGAFQHAVDPEERPASVLPDGQASEAEELGTSASLQQDIIPGYAAQEQENTPATPKTLEKGKTQTRIRAKTGPTKKRADDRTPEERTRCQYWQAFFNTRRGGEPLHKVGPRIDESDCIIVLVQKFSDAEITAIDTFVLTEKYPYTKPSEKHKVGARIVLDEYQNARECLKERGQWPGQTPLEEKREMPTFTPEGYDAAEEFGAYWGINELRSMSHAAF